MGSGIQVTNETKELLPESTIHRTFVACVNLMKAMLSCFNLKSDDCNLATTILLLNFFQLHETFILEKLCLEFL